MMADTFYPIPTVTVKLRKVIFIKKSNLLLGLASTFTINRVT